MNATYTGTRGHLKILYRGANGRGDFRSRLLRGNQDSGKCEELGGGVKRSSFFDGRFHGRTRKRGGL